MFLSVTIEAVDDSRIESISSCSCTTKSTKILDNMIKLPFYNKENVRFQLRFKQFQDFLKINVDRCWILKGKLS